MSEPLTDEEIRSTKSILENFYGSQVHNWRVSTRTLEVLGKLISKTKACDKVMDLIPRPYGGGAAIKWAKKQVRKAVLRKLNSQEGKHYIACMRASAVSMKTEFYMAGL